MNIEKNLLADYGNIIQEIGGYLYEHNPSTFNDLKKGLKLKHSYIRDGLAFLIQRRFVNFFIYKEQTEYRLDSKMIHRRLYFSWYTSYIKKNYDENHVEYFIKILVRGKYKSECQDTVIQKLIQDNIVIIDPINIAENSKYLNNPKKIKLSPSYLIVNYNYLDKKLSEQIIYNYICKKLNLAAGDVYMSISTGDGDMTLDKIISNLKSTKLLVSDSGMIINEKHNVEDYLDYLISLSTVQVLDRSYLLLYDLTNIMAHKIAVFVGTDELRTIFNQIYNSVDIEDKNLVTSSLLPSSEIRKSILKLQEYGLIIQNCLGDYSIYSRVDYSWKVSINTAKGHVVYYINNILNRRITELNKFWDGNYFAGKSDDATTVLLSDILSLGLDHFLFSNSSI